MFRKILIAVLVVYSTFMASRASLAKSGCCSWHGGVSYCDSSVGRYVCNDGSYSPTCDCYYSAPAPVCVKPTVGKSGSWTFTQNGCNQDVNFTWDKGTNDDFYSLVISKYKAGDPGPLSDTSSRSFAFKNIKPGTWYINLKPGRSCGWGDIVYWELTVPDVAPKVSFSETVITENERSLHYSVECATKAEISPSVGAVKLGSSFVTVYPKTDTVYTLTATNGSETTSRTLTADYPLVKPTTMPTVQAVTNEQTNNIPTRSSSDGGSFLAGLVTVVSGGGLVYYFIKRKKKQ